MKKKCVQAPVLIPPHGGNWKVENGELQPDVDPASEAPVSPPVGPTEEEEQPEPQSPPPSVPDAPADDAGAPEAHSTPTSFQE